MFLKINRQRLEDQSVNTKLNQPTRTTGHYAPPQYNSSSTALDTFAGLTIEDSMVPRKNERKNLRKESKLIPPLGQENGDHKKKSRQAST